MQHQSLDLASYIAALPPQIKFDVFSSPWTTQALFRALSPLAQQYILRLLYVDEGVSKDSMRLWVVPGAEAQHHNAVTQLEVLSVLAPDSRPGTVVLHPAFKACLRSALSGRGLGLDVAGRRLVLSGASMSHIMIQATKRWQGVLMYLLDCDDQLAAADGASAKGMSIQALLRSAGLVSGQGRRHELTAAGFRFLLKGSHEQVWLLLREYIKSAEATSGKELASTLSFLLQLSFRRVWQPYAMGELSAQEQDIAAHMAQLGLVHTFSQDGTAYFCVTPLAASLCGGSSSSSTAAAAAAAAGSTAASVDNAAYIIVETNFRVYAHTSCPLQRRLLARLMRTDCLLPNLFVGSLTREAFLAALGLGVSAADVAGFLAQHAHPQVARRVPSVPENVQEQLVLWESETRRVVAEPATLYSAFEDDDLFLAASHHAGQLGVRLWADNSQRQFAIKRLGHEALKGFIVEYKRQRERSSGL
uniref:RNA polymerase II transcription factor B subunit 2 n=1 Tax=Tetradesmus obliquus TaxID=3088 RepID=A0A383W7J1_TETOB|eukprot:jgi/Sobl393_1/10865/SZX72954.1